jgi:Sec-independent protein translocase protein TatA
MDNFKFIIIIILIVLLLGTGAFFLIRKKSDDFVKESKKAVKESNLTYDIQYYQHIASAIESAVKGWGALNTDEQAIYRNLNKLHTVDDWYMLVSVYGLDYDKKNLVDRLVYELDATEQEEVNSILSKFNISL